MTWEQVKAEIIRRIVAGETQAALALEFKVARSFVRMITRRVRREVCE